MTTIQKSPRLQIRIELDTYQGKEMINIREWYLEDDSGEWRPSKKGFTIPKYNLQALGELIAALEKVRNQASGVKQG